MLLALELLESRLAPADIGASVYFDLNLGVGSYASNFPLAGQTVYYDLKGDGKLDPGDPVGITDSSGNYLFTGLSSNIYPVRLASFPGDVVTIATVFQPLHVPYPTYVFGIQATNIVSPLHPTEEPFAGYKYGNGFNGYANLLGTYVTTYYEFFLNRYPTNVEVNAWVGVILQDNLSLGQVAYDFAHSTEYESDAIAGYYTTFLDRAGAPSEINAWVSYMQTSGASLEQVADLFLTSPEFNALHPNNSDFVQTLYTDLLGFTGSPAAVATWVAAINGGTSRAATAFAFLQVSEQRSIAADFTVFIGVYPGSSAINYWTQYLVDYGGYLTLADVEALFASCPQYQSRVLNAISGNG